MGWYEKAGSHSDEVQGRIVRAFAAYDATSSARAQSMMSFDCFGVDDHCSIVNVNIFIIIIHVGLGITSLLLFYCCSYS